MLRCHVTHRGSLMSSARALSLSGGLAGEGPAIRPSAVRGSGHPSLGGRQGQAALPRSAPVPRDHASGHGARQKRPVARSLPSRVVPERTIASQDKKRGSLLTALRSLRLLQVEDVCEADVLSLHLDEMFGPAAPPLPWDRERAYTRDKVQLVAEASRAPFLFLRLCFAAAHQQHTVSYPSVAVSGDSTSGAWFPRARYVPAGVIVFGLTGIYLIRRKPTQVGYPAWSQARVRAWLLEGTPGAVKEAVPEEVETGQPPEIKARSSRNPSTPAGNISQPASGVASRPRSSSNDCMPAVPQRVPVSESKTLMEVLRQDRLTVPGIPIFLVVSKGSAFEKVVMSGKWQVPR